MDAAPPPERRRRRAPAALAPALLLALFCAAAVHSLRGDSATFDETAHVGSGLAIAERGDFRLNTEHPPLAKALAGAAVLLAGERPADYTSEAFRRGAQWPFGFSALNGTAEAPRDPATVLVPARLAIVGLGAALGLVVFAWSRRIWGRGGALVSLALYCFSPTMLAHARLVTTDTAAALGFTLALFVFDRFRERPSLRRGAELGAAAGLALLAKLSLLVLAPLLVVLWLLPATRPRPHAARGGALAGVLAFAVLWAGYSFRFAASPDPSFALPWDPLRGSGPASALVQAAREWRVLPEAYLHGLAYALRFSRRLAFLAGAVHEGARAAYFPTAFVLKSTPAVLALVVWAAARLRGAGAGLAQVGTPLAGLVAYAISTALLDMNIGHRHLAPLYPLLFVLMGGLARIAERGAARAALLLLLASHAASAVLVHPGYLSYFNAFAGGPRGGHRFLVDSNVDWGQDLPRLRAWMDASGVAEVDLVYFGTADPRAYGIRHRKVFWYMDLRPEEPPVPPRPGAHLAVSATLLQGVYVPPALARWLAAVRTELRPVARAGDSIFIYRLPE